jgi:hypothetical protein
MASYLATLVIYLACLPVGAAALRAAGRPMRGYASAVGLAVLIVITSLAVKLPGRGVTSAVITLLVVVGCAVYARSYLTRPRTGTVVATLVLLLAVSIPFVVAGGIGIQGVGINFDMSAHVAWAETLRSAGIDEPLALPTNSGYPLGPHALVATAGAGLGIDTDAAFIGLALAIAPLALLAAMALLDHLTPTRRAVAGALVALPYMVAAYYGQGAFKETVEALFLLGYLAVLREMALARRFDPGGVALVAAIGAGSFYTYSYLGLSWMAAATGIWIAGEMALGGGWISARSLMAGVRALPRTRPRTAALWGLGVLVLFLALLPELIRALDFFRVVSFSPAGSGGIAADNVGNLGQAIPPLQATGLWPHDDFRNYFATAREAYKAGIAGGVGIAGVAVGAVWWLRRRDLVIPSAVLGAIAIYIYLRSGGQSPYVQAKALVLLAPLLSTLALGGLLAERPERDGRLIVGALAAAFVLIAAGSSLMALRGSTAGPADHPDELGSMRSIVAGKRVLQLPVDLFGNYRLRGSLVSGALLPQPTKVNVRGGKEFEPGRPLDFDWVTSETLDRFDYVVASRGLYASEPPANFQPVRTTRSYVLYRREGPTPVRHILPGERLDPAAPLDCTTAAGRRLSRRTGWARVTERHLALGPPGRRLPRGTRQSLAPGSSVARRLVLPAGRYEISLIYTAPRAPRIEGPRGLGVVLEPPPTLDVPSSFWHAGTIDWPGGVLRLRIHAASLPLGAKEVTDVGELAAVRTDGERRLVPLSEACGRYVDWYTLGAERPPVPRPL